MKTFSVSAIALAIGLAFSTGAMAQAVSKTEQMSKSEYTMHKDAIKADLKTAKTACDALTANAQDICIAKAKGGEKVAAAELEARYKPTDKSRNDVAAAKADAAYEVAKEQCDDKAGNAKDVCIKEAKAAQTAAKADAKAQKKVTQASGVAKEKSADANAKGRQASTDARKDAADEKRDADYAVAKEKCDRFSGNAKDSCITEAKARFGQS
ncbi:MAG: hypothetical protein WD886_01690 [Burkholderiales bacterium]